MIPSTTTRVAKNTSECVNKRIREEAENRIVCCAARGGEAIDRRIGQLDREWDIERALEANAATAALLGVVLGATVNRKWFAFPAFVGSFLLYHAIQGWCPPVPILRRLGFRTQTEIERERYALKALRGDFQNLPAPSEGQNAVEAATKAAWR
jgi:hypothetical protein